MEAIDYYLKQAYFSLGTDMVKELKFNKRAVRNEIILRSEKNLTTKIISMFNYSVGEIISYEAKTKRCAEITKILGLEKQIAVQDYFTIKKTTARDKQGKHKTMIQIIRVHSVLASAA